MNPESPPSGRYSSPGRLRPALRALAVSLLVLAPCYWQPRVAASDLMSHTYNAALALRIQRGELPGFRLALQPSNTLVDYLLEWLLRYFDAATTERLVVSLAVLVFFWGAMSLVAALRGQSAWTSAPVVAAIAYGWVLQQGLLNYYLSVGLSLSYLAMSWRAPIRRRLFALPLLALAWLGNPLPVTWAVAVLTFSAIASRLRLVQQYAVMTLCVAVVYIGLHAVAWPIGLWWRPEQAIYATGADQVLLYSIWSLVPAGLLLVLWLSGAVVAIRRGGAREFLGAASTQVFLITAACVVVLPAGFHVYRHASLVSLIPQRLSLIAAVVATAATLPAVADRSARWLSAVVAALFFGILFVDHVRITDAERQVRQLVDQVPPGSRVIGRAFYRNTRVIYSMMLERYCTDRCWSYANYEPSSGQFRVRLTGENDHVMSSQESVREAFLGTYVVRPSDLPLYQVENCLGDARRFCLRTLRAGVRNGDQ